jgi:PKD repeat protein
VNYGSSQTYTITPNTGYHVVDVLVNGASVGAITSYTFPSVTADQTISATFAINTFKITASAGTNGVVSPAGVTTVNYGSSQILYFIPNSNKAVKSYVIDGGSPVNPGTKTGVTVTYTFTNVIANHTVAVTFSGGTSPVPPIASFTGTPTLGVVPLSVAFTDTSTNSPTSWGWTFGDSGTSTAKNPSHQYMTVGTYTVTLTATNAYGSNTVTRTNYITVNPVIPVNHPPVAVADRYTTKMNTVLTILPKGVLTNDNDPDGDTLIAVLMTKPVHGTVVLKNDGSFTYSPIREYTGTDSFTYKANDGLTNSNIATVTLTVTKK